MERNEVIKSVLARCLIEPDFLSLAMSYPKRALYFYRHQPLVYEELLSIDFKGVLKFAGFITKVKNNNTWQSFHYTRLAMHNFKFESELFINYFPHFIDYKSKGNKDYKSRLDHFYK